MCHILSCCIATEIKEMCGGVNTETVCCIRQGNSEISSRIHGKLIFEKFTITTEEGNVFDNFWITNIYGKIILDLHFIAYININSKYITYMNEQRS